jgi:DNA-3-methyladenine glycosylase I
MEKLRCKWAQSKNPLMVAYHDTEWGVPVQDDQKLFEFIVLETAQAGLSWEVVLNKREGYRELFSGFDPKKIALYSEEMVNELMLNPKIIRNRSKILAAIGNAKQFLQIQKEFGSFSKYMWQWVQNTPVQTMRKSHTDIPVMTKLALDMSKDLKKRGFKFIGPTVWYAHMQAVGLVNDHTIDCFRHKQLVNPK